jgi:hypothetical protein
VSGYQVHNWDDGDAPLLTTSPGSCAHDLMVALVVALKLRSVGADGAKGKKHIEDSVLVFFQMH